MNSRAAQGHEWCMEALSGNADRRLNLYLTLSTRVGVARARELPATSVVWLLRERSCSAESRRSQDLGGCRS
jgi:hypothetical protein